jgi:hypothetical protein
LKTDLPYVLYAMSKRGLVSNISFLVPTKN